MYGYVRGFCSKILFTNRVRVRTLADPKSSDLTGAI